MYDYINNAIWHEEISNSELVYKAAKAFGQFHKTLKGFDVKELGEAIPNFHNTYQRYINLLNAIKEDKLGIMRIVKNDLGSNACVILKLISNEYSSTAKPCSRARLFSKIE